MLLTQSTWQEIDARIKSGKTGIIIPIGSHEQHGPTGLIGCDALCPEIIALEAEKEHDLLIAPTFSVGMAQHHLGFAGSLSLRPSTMIAAIIDWTMCLKNSGFTHIYWLNGHGGNVATIQAAFSESYMSYSVNSIECPFAHHLSNWWDLPNISKLCFDTFPTGHGTHATPSEVAVTYWKYQEREALNKIQLSPKIAPNGQIRDAKDYRDRFPDGRIGSDPTLATIELGGKIVTASVKALIEDFNGFLKT